MKFLHTADIHIGKRIFETSLIEDQRHILKQIQAIALQERVDAVVIAGDIYDRSVPPTEAVSLLDDFLTALVQSGVAVIMISGNHDSPERISFGDRMLEKQGLYIGGNYQNPLKRVTLEDAYGPVTFVCMPFVKPAQAGGRNNEEAVGNMLKDFPRVAGESRYVLVAHYFVTGEHGEEPELSDSETGISAGGLEHVPASLFSGFSYVALGHIHRPQRIGSERIAYAGSPLKYSFSEVRGDKSVNIVELDGQGKVKVIPRALTPLHDMRCIKGRLADLMAEDIYNAPGVSPLDYIQATLTDEEELIDPIGALRSVYPNVLQILLEKRVREAEGHYESRLRGERKCMEELFGDFYEMLKGEPLDEKRRSIVRKAVKEAEGEQE